LADTEDLFKISTLEWKGNYKESV